MLFRSGLLLLGTYPATSSSPRFSPAWRSSHNIFISKVLQGVHSAESTSPRSLQWLGLLLLGTYPAISSSPRFSPAWRSPHNIFISKVLVVVGSFSCWAFSPQNLHLQGPCNENWARRGVAIPAPWPFGHIFGAWACSSHHRGSVVWALGLSRQAGRKTITRILW